MIEEELRIWKSILKTMRSMLRNPKTKSEYIPYIKREIESTKAYIKQMEESCQKT